ncbi:MAG: DUF3078 domain-containing protein [Sphingobacteriales bacterium JAD_PAG50586_3]|nr:MAG: DUF3078 domain-containing protein [Sphingobacteriales bacterium JAD_PAG50586_3]
MKKIFTLIAILATSLVIAQTPTDTTKKVSPVDSAKKAVLKRWKTGFDFGLNFGAANFSNNWQGGGVSNYSLGSLLNARACYKNRDSALVWDNVLNLQYGIMRNKGQSMRKANDLIFFDSKLGYKFQKAWSIFAGVNFLSQFAFGYEYGTDPAGLETRKKISAVMSPGYLTESIGIEYKPVKYFSARLGIGAMRQTFVLNQSLYNTVDTVRYGVPVGDNIRNEIGFQLLVNFDKDLHKNINLKARYLGFYNYSDLSFDKIDHRFDIIFTAKITRFINVNFNTIFLYDFDQIDTWQHSQAFALGILYKMK